MNNDNNSKSKIPSRCFHNNNNTPLLLYKQVRWQLALMAIAFSVLIAMSSPSRLSREEQSSSSSLVRKSNHSSSMADDAELLARLRGGSNNVVGTRTSTTKKNDDDDNDAFRYCQVPILGQPDDEMHSFPIWYQCQGPQYDNFSTTILKSYAQSHHAAGNKTASLWGQRPTALPAGKTILALGNSYLRQIVLAMACQYAADIVAIDRYEITHGPEYMVTQITFRNNAILWVLSNTYAVFSPQWRTLLELQLNNLTGTVMTKTTTTTTTTNNNNTMPTFSSSQRMLATTNFASSRRSLDEMVDGVLLGHFNDCAFPFDEMYQRINLQLIDDNYEVDCHKYPTGPTVADLRKVLKSPDKPIAYVSPFSKTMAMSQQSQQAQKDVAAEHQNTNKMMTTTMMMKAMHNNDTMRHPTGALSSSSSSTQNSETTTAAASIFINARQHMDAMQHECSAKSRLNVNTRERDSCSARHNHQCAGQYGGHADLVVWDVQEFLFAHLE